MQSRNCLLNENENYCTIKHLLELKSPGTGEAITFPVLKIEHEPNKSDDDRSSCYKLVKKNPSQDYWWRFEAEPFKLGRAIFSQFGSILHKEDLPIMSL
jgi:hypothetical protein